MVEVILINNLSISEQQKKSLFICGNFKGNCRNSGLLIAPVTIYLVVMIVLCSKRNGPIARTLRNYIIVEI